MGAGSHALKLVHSLLGVARADLLEGLVLVPSLAAVLLMKQVSRRGLGLFYFKVILQGLGNTRSHDDSLCILKKLWQSRITTIIDRHMTVIIRKSIFDAKNARLTYAT